MWTQYRHTDIHINKNKIESFIRKFKMSVGVLSTKNIIIM